MSLVKKLILLFLLVFFATKTTYAACHFDCYIFMMSEAEGRILATSDEFISHGEHSGCRLVKNYRSSLYIFEVYEPVKGEFSLILKRGSDLLMSSQFSGNYGSLTYYAEQLRFSCTKQ